MKNAYLYNGKELFEDADLNWYDYGFRNYDPQIGRFPQLDPLTWSYPYYTPYQFAGCEPIANVDVDGLEPANVLKGIENVISDGGQRITASVIKNGTNAGKWAISWVKDGMAFSRIFHSTGFLTQRVLNTAAHLGSIGNTISNIGTSLPRGDLQTNSRIPNGRQMAVNAYSSALNDLEEGIEKGWRPAQHINPDDPILPGWQSWEVNHITGEKRIRGYEQAIQPVYPETVLLPLPKLGKALSWLAKLKVGSGVAKGLTNLIPKGKLANHLFKGAGKLADNPANRTLIEKISNSKALGVDAYGKSWYMGVDGAGKSIYTYAQNGVVKGAGYATMTPEEMIIKYGLK